MPMVMQVSQDTYNELFSRMVASGQTHRLQGGALNLTDVALIPEPERKMTGTISGVEGEIIDASKRGLWYKFLALSLYKFRKRDVLITLADVQCCLHDFKPSIPAVVAIENQKEVRIRLMSEAQLGREIRAGERSLGNLPMSYTSTPPAEPQSPAPQNEEGKQHA